MLLVLAASAGHAVETANAGAYSVSQCDYELAITASSFEWYEPGMSALMPAGGSGCAELGLGVRTPSSGSDEAYPTGSEAGYLSHAPPGTEITEFSAAVGTLSDCCVTGLVPVLQLTEALDGSGRASTVLAAPLNNSSWSPPSGGNGPVTVSWDADTAGFTTQRVEFGLRCHQVGGCAQPAATGLRMRARSFRFVLNDTVDPVIEPLPDSLTGSNWVRGTMTVNYAATDVGGGLDRIELDVGEGTPLSSASSCESVATRYVALQPCPANREGAFEVDTADLSDGHHTVVLRAVDIGGRLAERPLSVPIDNSAPNPPTTVVVDGGSAWRADNQFDLRWNYPVVAHAPISYVHYKLCAQRPGGQCAQGVRAAEADGVLQLDVSEPGSYVLEVWLEDAAGNVDANATSGAAILRFDDEAPGHAKVESPSVWLDAQAAKHASVALSMSDDEAVPTSGISGFSVSTDGRMPNESIDAHGNVVPAFVLKGIPEGVTRVRARAISGAGVAAGGDGVAPLKIDRSPPVAAVGGAPAQDDWSTAPVEVRVSGVDQRGLSGMDPAPSGSPVESGGYVRYAVDGRSDEVVRGDGADVEVASDGRHVVAYEAFDVAGNSSGEKSVSFKIDRTGPEGGFEARDAADPRRLSVRVFDATSGVAGGRIEYRRDGATEFTALPTHLAEGRLTARVDDEGLPDGRYELRAVVSDVAGNESVIARQLDGTATALSLPVRGAARIDVAAEVRMKRCRRLKQLERRSRRRGKARRRMRCRARWQSVAAGKPARLRHGRPARSIGTVTAADGQPLAGVPVVVEAQPRSGGPFVAIGSRISDAAGQFRFKVTPGPSRTVRYRFAGTDTFRPATAQLTTRVPAAARLKVNRRRLRNGQAVRFTGRLLGGAVPSDGKLVALQARVGRRWRTFATPRANAKGVFRHRYRFTSTTGRARYEFRVVVAREAAYPYERGVSRRVRVVVRGR